MFGIGAAEIAILGVVCVLPVMIGVVVLVVVLGKKAAAGSAGPPCAECGTPIPPDGRFCPKCGRATSAK